MVSKQLKLVKCSLKGKCLFYMGDKVIEKMLYKIMTQSMLATSQIQAASLITNNKNGGSFSLFPWDLKKNIVFPKFYVFICSMYLLFECPSYYLLNLILGRVQFY